MKAEDLIQILVYVMPGFVAWRTYDLWAPRRKKSEFVETGESVILGAILTGVVRLADVAWFGSWLQSNREGFPGLRFLLALFFSGVLAGLIMYLWRVFKSFLSHRVSWLEHLDPTNAQALWMKINTRPSKDWAVVYLEDGSIYRGWIKQFTYDPDQDESEFLLARAVQMDNALNVIHEVTGKGVYLRT